MTSEIRANTLKNRVGLATVSLTNTGIVVSGIVTATGAVVNGDIDVDGHTNLDNVSIAGVTTVANTLRFNDNVYASFGTDGDASLYHDGSHLRFRNGTGNFNIQSNDFQITDSSNTTLRFRVDADGATYLRHNGSDRLITSNTGVSFPRDIDVDGHTNLDNVSVAGVSTFTGNIDANGNLDVGGSGGITISYSGADLTMNSAGAIFTGNGGNATDPIVANVSDTNTGFFYPAADTLAVTTGGTERLRIHSNGRTVIGGNASGTQPSATVGGAQFYGGSYPGDFRISSGAGASGTTTASIAIMGSNHNASIENGANSGAHLNLYNYNTTDGNSSGVMFMNSNGLAASRILGLNVSHSSRTGALVFMTSNGSHPTQKLRITSDGKVLVGSSSITPSRNLDVRGTGHQQILIGSTNNSGVSLMLDGHGGGDGNGGNYGTVEMGSDGHLDIRNYDPAKNIVFGVGSNVGGNDSVVIKSNGYLGVGRSPDTKVEVPLSAFAATGDDDASDWGANGIFQLLHQGTAAANNEVLLLGAYSGAVGQLASGIGFGRESTSHWGTYLSFKTHSSSTANIDELKERARIKSDGTFEVGYLQPADGSSANRAAKSALEIKRHYPQKTSGNYWILDRSGTPRQIYCEMETDGGGWMLWHDHNAPGSKTSMNIALGGSDASPSSNLSRSYYNNYAYYTVWIKASQIDATGERLHSFVTLDGDGELKYVADYGSDFLLENVGDQYQPNLNYYFNSGTTGEYVGNTMMYQPQCGATGWENFSNGGWSEVYIREMDTRISPGDHRSLHLVERIYNFDSNGVPFWIVAESMHPTPHWSDFSLIQGEAADGNNPNIQTHNVEINSMNGNNGPSVRARARGVLTGTFEYTFQLGYNWGWSIACLNATIGIENAIKDQSSDPYSAYTQPYYHASLYNNSSNNLWYPTSRAAWQSSDASSSHSPGINYGNHVLWRESDGTIKARDKSGTHSNYTFPTKFAGPLIMCSGSQSPHYTKLQSVWNTGNTYDSVSAFHGRNRWYK